MQGLILETSGRIGTLILCRNEHPIAHMTFEGGSSLSKSLGLHVQHLLEAYAPFPLDFIAVGRGPGSYTGIRVGASMAKALAFGNDAKLVYFCSLEPLFPMEIGDFSVLRDAHMGGFYRLEGRRTPSELHFQSPALISLREAEYLPLETRFVSDEPEKIRQKLRGRTIEQAHLDPQFLAARCTELSRRRPFSPLEPSPLSYLSVPPEPKRPKNTENHVLVE